MKFTPGIGIGLKFMKIDISIETLNRKTRNQLTLNSTRIRFDVRKLTPVSETMLTAHQISMNKNIPYVLF